MSLKNGHSLEQLRKIRNKELMRRVRNGESTNSFDSSASWFPPRPIIKKDPKAINQLYGKAQPLDADVIAEVAMANANAQAKEEEKRATLTRVK